jgi:glycosyltransferase involved in cell wall biosynthesis
MRIAMISEHASPLVVPGTQTGQQAHVAELSSALAQEGHDVRVYTRRADSAAPDLENLAAGAVVQQVPVGPARPVDGEEILPYLGDFGHWLRQAWQDGPWTPDVAHAHFWRGGLAALSAAGDSRLPVAVTYHALGSVMRRHQDMAEAGPRQRVGYERVVGRTADAVVAQSSYEVAELVRLGVPRQLINLVPGGVDPDLFTAEGPAQPRGRNGRILCVGRLAERQGYGDVIRALRAVPGAECVIVGGPPGAELGSDAVAGRLRAVADSAGVAERVRLVGGVPRADLPAWYRSADALACTPRYEPFGNTALEAMACGVPVVAYALGGYTDSVVDGVTGLLVPPRDVRSLASALRRLLAEPARRLSYATAAVDRAVSCYAWRRTADQLTKLYQRLIDNRRGLLRASPVAS